MRVRFRVDGVLYEAARVPKRMVSGVVSRVKIMSELDIAEKRVPQDGRVERQRRRPQGRPADHDPADPARRGRDVRILDKEQALRTLDELGMDGSGRDRFQSAIRRPRTAPCWSPARPARASRRRCTRRSPSSTRSRRTSSRSRTRSSTGSTGSTRSTSTARPGSPSPPACARCCAPTPTSSWSARSATPRPRGSRSSRRSPATWCSRPCTPTTRRARSPGCRRWGSRASSPPRPSTASSPSDLARKLCTHCKRRTVIPQEALLESGFRVGTDLEAYEPVGCGRCNHTGYKGRIGIFSVMEMSERIKDLTVGGAPEARSPRSPARRAC